MRVLTAEGFRSEIATGIARLVVFVQQTESKPVKPFVRKKP